MKERNVELLLTVLFVISGIVMLAMKKQLKASNSFCSQGIPIMIFVMSFLIWIFVTGVLIGRKTKNKGR